jgi:hypothetical protein
VKRHLLTAIGIVLLLALAIGASAQGTKTAPAKKGPPKPVKLRGEILDLGCYLARNLRGAAHRDCAAKCLLSGVPMGLLTADSTVYLISMDHGRAMTPESYQTPNPYDLCKQSPAAIVDVSGFAYEKGGIHIIEITRAALAPTAEAGSAP